MSETTVLILTPMKNAVPVLDSYCRLLESLAWPANRLAIGILEGDSSDGTWDAVQSCRARLEARAARVVLCKKDYGFQIPEGLPRWTPAFQVARRQILARARNQLLFRALAVEDYVLWIDADVVAAPVGIVATLIETGFEIVTPNCVTTPGGPSFDWNAWTDGGERHLSDWRGAGQVRLQSVGGTMLLVRADLHRDGLVFPPFRYGNESPHARPVHPVWGRGEIETEGLATMALDMGVQPWGLPDLEIVHA